MVAIRVFVLICLASQLTKASFGQNMACDTVYTMVDEAPMFRNGYDELAFYIDNLDYKDCGVNKTMTLIWTIDRSGQVVDIDAKGLEGECKSRVIAQLEKFPLWTPARVMGMPVCFKMKVTKVPR